MLLPCSMPIVVEYGRWNQKTYDLVPKSHRLTIQKSWTYHSKVVVLQCLSRIILPKKA